MYTRSYALLAGLVVLTAALVVNAVVALGAVRALGEGYERQERTYETLSALNLLFSALQDVETGQRGFLLTGEESYLAPYYAGLAQVDTLLAQTDALLRTNPRQAARLPALHDRIRRRIAVLDEGIRLRREGDVRAAVALVQTGRGKAEMDAIRALVGASQDEERAERSVRASEVSTTGRRAFLTVLFSNLALLAALGGAGLLLRRNLRLRERTAAALRAANDALSAALAEREAALAHVQAMQGQLVQQEKLASLGRLTAGVAHEIKNPLNFVNNFASLSTDLVDDLAEAVTGRDLSDEARAIMAELRQNTEKIVEHGQRADDIVQSMLVHARGVSGDRQRVDLHAVLDAAVEQAVQGPPEDAGIAFERLYDPALAGERLCGVGTALGRLFLNLIENGVHAVRQRAGTAVPGYTPTVRLTTRLDEDRMGRAVAVVEVADNGPGIPDAILPRVFEPFYTTKAPGQGTGLGLSLAYDIALGHGGTLVADYDEEREGALFLVTLPLDPPDATGDGAAV